jgi:hypothetical protein
MTDFADQVKVSFNIPPHINIGFVNTDLGAEIYSRFVPSVRHITVVVTRPSQPQRFELEFEGTPFRTLKPSKTWVDI